jgi:hypothetical protein
VTATTAPSLDQYWSALVTVALLGTDRRDPPAAPEGLVADLVDDTTRTSPSQRMLAAVSAAAAARRAGFISGPPTDRLAPPEPDPRPICTAAAAATWMYIVDEWSVLEDEWVLTVIERGMRLPPDVVVALLVRHRTDATRLARAAVAAGPVARWVTEHVPELAPRTSARVDADAVLSVPPLAVPPELAQLLGADAHTFSSVLATAFESRQFGASHRAVLVNLMARCRPEVLEDAATALGAIDPMSPSAGLALALADLARTRSRMLRELTGEEAA